MSAIHTRRTLRRLGPLALAPLIALAAGCQILPEAQPDRTRYFVLAAPASAHATDASTGITVGLRAIELPGYLRNTRSMVVARGPNELSFWEEDRWAEPLDAGLARVFREALQASEQIDRVTVFPFSSEQSRDFDLLVRILHCEGVQTGQGEQSIRFAAHYEVIQGGAAGEIVKRGIYRAPSAAWDGEPGSLAAGLAEAVVAAATAIAAELP